nr:hypothetical protein [Chroococcidiopsis sp. TS-821]
MVSLTLFMRVTFSSIFLTSKLHCQERSIYSSLAGGLSPKKNLNFSAARAIAGKDTACYSVNRVNCAISRMFASRGMN